jgi:hypothetical protein
MEARKEKGKERRHLDVAGGQEGNEIVGEVRPVTCHCLSGWSDPGERNERGE